MCCLLQTGHAFIDVSAKTVVAGLGGKKGRHSVATWPLTEFKHGADTYYRPCTRQDSFQADINPLKWWTLRLSDIHGLKDNNPDFMAVPLIQEVPCTLPAQLRGMGLMYRSQPPVPIIDYFLEFGSPLNAEQYSGLCKLFEVPTKKKGRLKLRDNVERLVSFIFPDPTRLLMPIAALASEFSSIGPWK